MKMKSPKTPTSTDFDEHSTSAFPYRLGLNDNPHQDQQNSSDAIGISSSTPYVTNSEPEFELIETYLRFPLTKCHHLIPFNMPETYLNESSKSILPCGCWTGKAPDAQIQEAALFVGYFGGETSFKSVWDVTGLGLGGCWKCGALEVEVDEGNGAAEGVVDHSHNPSYANGGHLAGRGNQRVSKQTGGVISIKEAFLEGCRQWQKLEDWKDEWYSGDMAERGAKLMAESRWAMTDD